MKPIRDCVLLYIEDDDATAYLFQIALRQSDVSPQLYRVTDGEQALSFVTRTGPYRDAPRPDLVLLDLNLPRRSGFDVLAHIKADPLLRDLRVVVFSNSMLPYDREKSFALGADDYLRKGGDLDEFVEAAESVCRMLGTA